VNNELKKKVAKWAWFNWWNYTHILFKWTQWKTKPTHSRNNRRRDWDWNPWP